MLRIIRYIDTQISRIPEPVMNILNFSAMVITIATGIGIPTSIYALLTNHVEVETVKTVPGTIFLVAGVVSIFFLLVKYFLLKLKMKKNQNAVSSKYYNLLHDFRNEINQIELYYKEIENGKRNWDIALFTEIVSKFLIIC